MFDFARAKAETTLNGHGSDVRCVQWHDTKSVVASGEEEIASSNSGIHELNLETVLSTLHTQKGQ